MALTRRQLLSRASTLTAAVVAGAAVRGAPAVNPFGPLRPTVDLETGLALLRLPEGFSYRSYGWTGDAMIGGAPVPKLHDGMGAFRSGDRVRLVRNHEISEGAAFCEPAYDSDAGGGTTTLTFDLAAERWLGCAPTLSGTVRNCAGGVTPWGSWLTCEEPNRRFFWSALDEPHGWVFEVPADGPGNPRPIEALGRFRHEAAAVDATGAVVYLTEDMPNAGFYRFLAAAPNDLHGGGALQMLAVEGRGGFRATDADVLGTWLPVRWVDVPDPTAAELGGAPRGQGVAWQGWQRGAAVFERLEGCWLDGDRVYFASTSGGRARRGQIWEYAPSAARLRLLYESPGSAVLDRPDNLTVTPGGAVLICENGRRTPTRLNVLTTDGRLYAIAENNVLLDGAAAGRGHHGNFTHREWAGACIVDDWLFVNIQIPGITFAVKGPWGALG